MESKEPKIEENSSKFTFIRDESDPLKDNYGLHPFIQSKGNPEERFALHFIDIKDIDESYIDKTVKFRARLQRSRMKGKGGFLIFRDQIHTIQGCLFVTEGVVSVQMVKFASSLHLESLVDVKAKVKKAQSEVEKCSKKTIELDILELFLVSCAPSVLPFQMEDAMRKVNPEQEEDDYVEKKTEDKKEEEETKDEENLSEKQKKKKDKKKKKEEKKAEKEKKDIVVKMNTRLDNRVLDLRVPTTQAIFKLQAGVCHKFRDFLDSQDFIEIHTTKLNPGASEGGANVFKFDYFGNQACLAQSPQLYKQMCIVGDFKRVYEIGAVFRAENSLTSRHLCEFTGLDLEMEFKEHYFEVLDIIGELFYNIFEHLNKNYKSELEAINNQYPFEPLIYKREALKLKWQDGVKLLEENGYKQDVNEDLETENEKALGKIVHDKYQTDFYILYGYPKSARPFYTMPDAADSNFTNSYDAFIRGEEVLSGAQRVHDYELLLKQVKEKGINPSSLEDYLNSFKLGSAPHGGAGIGLERVVKLFIGLGNVKKCVLFPRDPKRLRP